MMNTKKCECCGVTFEGSKKFCSDACKNNKGRSRHTKRLIRVNNVTYRVIGSKKIRHDGTDLVPAHTDFSTSAWVYNKGWADKDAWNWWVSIPKTGETFGPTDFSTAKRVSMGMARGLSRDEALLEGRKTWSNYPVLTA